MANQILYGFVNLKDVFARRVQDIGIEVVNRAITASVAEHNRQLDSLLSLFATRTSEYSMRYTTPTVARLQPLDEDGRARPIKVAGFYDVAWPIQMAGSAWGENYVSRAKMTVQEANDYTVTLVSADMRWMRDHILAALFTNVNWTFADPDHGNLTIKGLANGDTDTYLIQAGADDGATDTHFLAQAAAIADAANPFGTIYDELTEHPENGGEVVTLIPPGLKADVTGLTNFMEAVDPNIAVGIGVNRLIGSLGVAIPGKLLGYVADGPSWIVEWKGLPAGYMVSLTTGGEPVLAMREDEETELRGFFRAAERNDHPFFESQWMRRAGFGAWNRVGAVVTLIGSGSYSIPTNYGSPMS